VKQPAEKWIVVATDGSAGAALAVEEGVWLAKMLDAGVTFVAVARPPFALLGDPYYQRALTEELTKARRAVAAAIPLAEERHVPYETGVVEGTTAEAIIEVARARNAELIVVGSRGRGGVTGTVLGSVSTAVVHQADRPVLVARTSARVRAEAKLRASV
jgi:nucleotide-binding universal stress UspA family protein